MDQINKFIIKNNVKKAAIIGGGFIGLEMVESLKNLKIEITLIEMIEQIFPPADPEIASMLQEYNRSMGIKLILNCGAEECRDEGSGLDISLTNGKSVTFDMAILAIGVKPDTEFLKNSGIKTNKNGAIIVDHNMKTNLDNIYAVGDAIEVIDFISGERKEIPLAGPANRQGRIAADNMAGIKSTYKNTQGTAICKIFELTAAVTGLNEKNAKSLGIKYIKSYTHSQNHAGYYPGSSQMAVKILFTPDEGKLLGAQIVGKHGVDKRIDVLATAIRNGLTVYDLCELELAYAPPYGSAKDPVNIAGFVAQNILENRMPVFYAEDIEGINFDKQVLLDVRTEPENKEACIAGSKLIPIDELRSRLDELEKDKEILVYCRVGFRGYLATRILMQKGFTVKNLSGGYLTYAAYNSR
ncbi:FAD-dependent oxidoreductase [Spirochaetota bacterium]